MTTMQEISDRVAPILKSAGAKRASIFGSYARGEQNVNSDLDIIIDAPDGMTLFDMSGLLNELEDTLGIKVDLITYGGVHPRIEPYISKDAVVIF